MFSSIKIGGVNTPNFSALFGSFVAALLLAACAAMPSKIDVSNAPAEAAVPAPDPAAGPLYRIDSGASRARVLVFRGGRAARLGHNHVMAVSGLSGFVQLPAVDQPEVGRFALEFRLDGLQVDRPELRAALGAAWASTVSPEAADGTRTNMLRSLEADRYPLVRVRSLRMAGAAPKLAAEVEVELHGQRRAMNVPLNIDVSEGAVKAAGALVIRQSDFGIAPFSVMGGLLAVQDELVVEFELVALRS